MPIYEYQCSECGHELEKLQKLGDPPLSECPACGRPALSKRVSAAGFRLKGGGWYETDFKGNKHPSVAKPEAGSKPESKSESASKGPPAGEKKPD
jgi:putative FmdB family regulatory protein